MNCDKLKKARLDKKLTQADLASMIGVKRAVISKYESGTITSIPHFRVIQLANALDVSPSYLLDWEEKPSSSMILYQTPSILLKYNQLNEQGKEKTDAYVDDLLENPKYAANQEYIVYGKDEEIRMAAAHECIPYRVESEDNDNTTT